MTIDTHHKLESDIQEFSPGALVTLYKLDLTTLGGSVIRFIEATDSGNPVVWRGDTYTPIDLQSEGWEYRGDGKLPRPKIRIANTSLALAGSIIAYDDLLGGILTRYRTFRKYMDGEAEEDISVYFQPDIYLIERKTIHTKFLIEFELAGYLDFEGFKLPRRNILRDTCTHRYRLWDTDLVDFDYSNASCPYTDSNYFDRAGDPVASGVDDVCGKKLSDCELRFPTVSGSLVALPTRAFPGVARTRIRT
jgi:lambda family phage minor tail protein L